MYEFYAFVRACVSVFLFFFFTKYNNIKYSGSQIVWLTQYLRPYYNNTRHRLYYITYLYYNLRAVF